MKRLLPAIIAIAALPMCLPAAEKPRDWANFNRYSAQNAADAALPDSMRRVVFLGNSITDFWSKHDPEFFTCNGYINRGISGQTTYQFLARFRRDVVDLHPQIVVINAATNDIAENTHPYNPAITVGNIRSIIEIARANNITPVLTTTLPASRFYWDTTITDVPRKIVVLNDSIRLLAAEYNLALADYYTALADSTGGLPQTLSKDGVHPNLQAYGVMENVIQPVLKTLLEQ